MWAIPFFVRQFIFPTEGNNPFIVGGQGHTVKKQSLEEGDQGWKPSRLLPPRLACFHLSMFISQACCQPLCAANNAAQRCWACHAQCPQPATPGWHCPLSVLTTTMVAPPVLSYQSSCISLARSAGSLLLSASLTDPGSTWKIAWPWQALQLWLQAPSPTPFSRVYPLCSLEQLWESKCRHGP